MAETEAAPANDNAKCPICGKAREAKYDPFCSKRCADVDLYAWLKGRYVIPGEAVGGKENDEN